MTTTTCPTCNKVVDPLRARSVGVRDGKVVAYCSAECAAAAESRPVSVKIRTPAAGVAVVIPTSPDSGPIIEIIREGSVPTAAPAADPASGSGKKGKKNKKGGKGTDTPAAGTPVATAAPASAATPAAGVPTARDSKPLILARRDHTPTPVELARRRAELAAAEEADEDAMINGEDAPPERKLPVGLILLVAVVIAAAVVIAVKLLSHGGGTPAGKPASSLRAAGHANAG